MTPAKLSCCVGLLVVASCATPKPPVPPIGVGGSAATGGQSSVPTTAGAPGTGGQASPGGASSTGGTSGSSCPVVEFPSVTPTAPANQTFRADHHPPMLWKPRRPHKTTTKAEPLESSNACSVIYSPNNKTPLNQGQIGSCTGNAGVKSLSIAPFRGNYVEAVAVEYYHRATNRDNGCACDSQKCSGAYPPNDQGSSGDSVYTCMQEAGILKGFTPADTATALWAGLTAGRACIIGMRWYNSEFNPLPSGQIKVTTSSGVAGGHEVVVIAHDTVNARTWIINSWGLWGVCFANQMTAATPVDGTGCGYAWLSDADVVKLYGLGAEGDCPALG